MQINIPGIGKVEVNDSFATLTPEEQNKAVEQIAREYFAGQSGNTSAAPTESSLGSDVASAAGNAALYTGGKIIDFGTGTAADLIKNIPGIISDISEGDVLGASWKLVSPVAGNAVEVTIEVAADGTGYVLKTGGKAIAQGTASAIMSGVEKLNAADLDVSKATDAAQQIRKDVGRTITNADMSIFEKIASAPGAAALSFVNELTFGATVALAEAAGYNAQEYLDNNPEAANAGQTAGFLVGLAGGPVAAAKLAGKGAKILLRKSFRDHAKRQNFKKIYKDKADLERRLENLSPAKGADAEVVNRIANDMRSQIKDIESFSKTARTKANEFKESPTEVRKWWSDEVNVLPKNHVLRKYPDIYEHWTDRMLKPSQRKMAETGFFKDVFYESVRDSAMLAWRNAPATAAELLAEAPADFTANYYLAKRNALDKGLSEEEAADVAWEFAEKKAPTDFALDLIDKMTPEGLAWLAPTLAARLYVVSSKTAGDEIKDPRTGRGITDYTSSDFYSIGEHLPTSRDYVGKNQGGLLKMKQPKQKAGLLY